MIDLTKYDGHEILCSHAWYSLRADAALLLAEVKRLRARLDALGYDPDFRLASEGPA